MGTGIVGVGVQEGNMAVADIGAIENPKYDEDGPE